jgi:AcrR family transcriptional regulator
VEEGSKPDRILDGAAELFATKPFHEVRLEDIAARAHVGKGTVYLYWVSKEDVYLAVIRRGFAMVSQRLERELPACTTTWERLGAIVGAIVDFAFAHPGVYRIMRSGQLTPEDPELLRIRADLAARIERTIRDGVAAGELHDPWPALTTQYLFSFVRGAMLYPPAGLTPEALRDHVMGVLRGGIAAASAGGAA